MGVLGRAASSWRGCSVVLLAAGGGGGQAPRCCCRCLLPLALSGRPGKPQPTHAHALRPPRPPPPHCSPPHCCPTLRRAPHHCPPHHCSTPLLLQVVLPSTKVKSFTESPGPVAKDANKVKYGKYDLIKPWTVEPLRLHYENPKQFKQVGRGPCARWR